MHINKEKKRVLVTGAAGFLGSHLCDRLVDEGFKVIGMDNLSTGNMDNIAHLVGRQDFQFLFHDVSNYIYVTGDIDFIFSFASPASPVDYLKLPIQTLKVGALGTHNCLGLAKAKKARMIVASTSEVYGDPKIHPQIESYWGNVNPIGPRGVYDEAKRYMEAMTMAYHNVHRLDTRIVRIFNTYGPRMRVNDGRALPNFFSQAIKGEDITIYGDGLQTRSFCYVSDLIEGIFRLMMSDYIYPVNLGNDQEVSLKQVAEEIVELTSSKSQLIYQPLPLDDPRQRRPDITRAYHILNYAPKISRAEGFEITYTYFKSIV